MEFRATINALNVYDPAVVPGSAFKIEDENFDPAGSRRELWFYGTRGKAYALYATSAGGELMLARTTTVNLNFGHASSPHRTEHLSRLASLAPNTCRTERNREFKPPVREGRRWRQQLRA
jgi:hypothetical protein